MLGSKVGSVGGSMAGMWQWSSCSAGSWNGHSRNILARSSPQRWITTSAAALDGVTTKTFPFRSCTMLRAAAMTTLVFPVPVDMGGNDYPRLPSACRHGSRQQSSGGGARQVMQSNSMRSVVHGS